jgi:hypothetical protein
MRKLELENEKINPTIPLERFPCGFVGSTFNSFEVSTLFPTRKCPKGFLCDVWHKIILKRSCYPEKKTEKKMIDIGQKLLKIKLSTCENVFFVPTIELALLNT